MIVLWCFVELVLVVGWVAHAAWLRKEINENRAVYKSDMAIAKNEYIETLEAMKNATQ